MNHWKDNQIPPALNMFGDVPGYRVMDHSRQLPLMAEPLNSYLSIRETNTRRVNMDYSPVVSFLILERLARIELASIVWKTRTLPLSYSRVNKDV